MTTARTPLDVDATYRPSRDTPDGDLLGEAPHVADARARAALKARLFPDSTPLAPHIGRFNLLRELGRGGMGIVYAAYDETLNRRVALKLLYDLPTRDPHAQARLLREAQAMARLNHPNIAAVYEAGTHEGRVYLAMEFVQGRPLDVWLREKPRSWQEVVDVFLQAAHGLHAAHAAGLVHRDFKPANAMLGDDGRVRVLDFGLARGAPSTGLLAAITLDATAGCERPASEHMTAATTLPTASLTLDGTIVGTPAYMSPEQFRGEKANARADQFALCAAFYETLHGRLPYGHTISELSKRLATGERAPIDPSLPAWLIHVLDRGLAIDPPQRFESMEVLAGALERGRLSGGTIRSAPKRVSLKPEYFGYIIIFLAAVLGASMTMMAYRTSLFPETYFIFGLVFLIVVLTSGANHYRGSIARFGKPKRTEIIITPFSPIQVFELITQNAGRLDHYVEDQDWDTLTLCLRTRQTPLSSGSLLLLRSRRRSDRTEVQVDIRSVSGRFDVWSNNQQVLSWIIELLGGEALPHAPGRQPPSRE